MPKPTRSPAIPAETRKERLAEALRANLMRRKAQQRARRAQEAGTRPSVRPDADNDCAADSKREA